MADRLAGARRPFRAAIAKWRQFPSSNRKPAAVAEAELVLGILERFSGYTLASLMDEDVQLYRYLAIEALARAEPEDAIDERAPDAIAASRIPMVTL